MTRASGILSALTAVGTMGAVFAALFGEWLRARLFRPRLAIRLVCRSGELTQLSRKAADGSVVEEPARYFHVRVTNRRRWPRATDVQVWLARIETLDASGRWKVSWASEVPLRWKFQEIHPLARTIGPQADCDVLSVAQADGVQLQPMMWPNNLTEFSHLHGVTDLVLRLEARSGEQASAQCALRVSWDGKWAEGESEMNSHLVVQELEDAA